MKNKDHIQRQPSKEGTVQDNERNLGPSRSLRTRTSAFPGMFGDQHTDGRVSLM